MRNATKFLLFAVLAASAAPAQRPAVVGAYRECPFFCRTVLLNPDHTFVLELDGDLYNKERYHGTWQILDADRIRAVTAEDTSEPRVVEGRDDSSPDFRVTVTDVSGAVVSSATVGPVVSAQAAVGIPANDAGEVTLARCEEFEVRFDGYRGRYRPLDDASNVFTVVLSHDQMRAWAFDETWLLKDGRLYVVGDDGSVDWDRYLAKLSAKETKRIFGQ